MSDDRTTQEVQAQIDDAFKNSPNNLSYTQSKDEAKTTKQYLLKDLMYYDLQKYLHKGLELPADVPSFTAEYPSNNLTKLNEMDPNVYTDIQTIFVRMNQNCNHFEQNTMSKFGTVTAGIIVYCDNVSRYMTGKSLIRDSLNVMLDDTSSPADFSKAKTNIKACMTVLAKKASDRAADCDSLVKDLQSFQALCTVDAADIDYLNHQFNIGKPVYKSRSDRTPADNQETYTDRLNDEIGALNKEVDDLQHQISQEEDERQHDIVVAGTAATYIWLGPCGLIAGATVMGVYGARAEELRGKIDGQKSKLSDDQNQAAALSKTIQMVQGINSVIIDLDKTIKKAIEAVTAMKNSFTKQESDLNDTKDQWVQVSQGADGDPDEMIVTMSAAVDQAISDWAELKILAVDFMANSAIQYQNE